MVSGDKALCTDRTDRSCWNQKGPTGAWFVTTAKGKKLKHKFKAYSLVECSAKKKLNLGEVFDEAVRAAEKKPHAKPRVCAIQ